MIKKVHILNPCDTSGTGKKQMQCTVCKTNNKSKSVLYVCESGHVMCKICRDATMKDCSEVGDNKTKKELVPNNDMKQLQIKTPDIKIQDLASGDHDAFASQGRNNEVKKDCKEDDTLLIYKENCSKSNMETTVEYKNPYYQESKSSITANVDCSKNTERKKIEMQSCNIVPRPVVCPVTMCSKIVTIDSIMLHFHFDHSKVPRTTLDDITPQEVLLKSSNFSTEIQCLATFIIETQKSFRPSKTIKKRIQSTSVRNSMKDAKLLLLMAVRLPTNPIKLPNVKCDTSRVFTRSIHTQTDKINENDSGINTECLSKSSSDYKSCTSKSVDDEDEVLLLWLCKLNDAEKVFSITLLGEDKRRGYCYIGDAVHVRDKQDPTLLYDRSECLIVKWSTISSLYDLNGQITVIVSMIG